MVPPGSENLTALDNRLSATTATATRSAQAGGTSPDRLAAECQSLSLGIDAVVVTGALHQDGQVDIFELQREFARRHVHEPSTVWWIMTARWRSPSIHFHTSGFG